MKRVAYWVGIVVIAIAAIMLLPSASSLPTAATAAGATSVAPAAVPASSTVHTASTAAAASSTATGAVATQASVLAALKSEGVPSRDVFLPNFGAQVATGNDIVTPLYNVSPAPMGIGDFGIQDVDGHNVGTVTETSSVMASVTLDSVNPVYVTSSGPDAFTLQLNTVGVHIDLFGNSTYQFWLQNVPLYEATSHTLSFEDNIWNFSSPAVTFSANSIYSHGPYGVVDAPTLYYSGGPSFTVPTPFTVVTYNNVSVQNGRSSVYFNYTVIPSNGPAFSGSYDHVEFNSEPATYGAAPAPSNEINGKSIGDTGFLLNDAEIMFGGPGGGSTTTLFGIQGQMSLRILPNGSRTYEDVPAAYDFGTDTGETSEGIAEYATAGANPVAILGSGPSLLYPLWGIVGAQQGGMAITVNLDPTNAFVFVTSGPTFSESFAEWAPTPTSGPATYVLSPGVYTFQFLLSDYAVQTITFSHAATATVTLRADPRMGDYTPLWAESNSQLAAISAPGGRGTVNDPYVLDNGRASVDPLFGEVNDYAFPVFPGIYLIDTTAYVVIQNMPTFNLTYLPIWNYAGRLADNGLPLTDQLNYEFYGASHVSIVNNPDLSGWFFTDAGFGEPASIYLWNSSDNLIAGNTFYVQSNGITASGGTNNVIWGNVFVPAGTSAAYPPAVLNYGAFPAIWEFESGDLIYNNEVLTPITALALPENFYTGAFQVNLDQWNVPVQPAFDVNTVNGFRLSGNILGLRWEGGNYWSNYGTASDPYGVLPYNDGGYIVYGGDYAPLVPFPLYAITFSESGLPRGTTWSVTLNGYTQQNATGQNSITFYEPNGAYSWTASPASNGETAAPASGVAYVHGANAFLSVHYR